MVSFQLDLAGELRTVLAGLRTILAWLGRHMEIAQGERYAELVSQVAQVEQARDLLLALQRQREVPAAYRGMRG